MIKSGAVWRLSHSPTPFQEMIDEIRGGDNIKDEFNEGQIYAQYLHDSDSDFEIVHLGEFRPGSREGPDLSHKPFREEFFFSTYPVPTGGRETVVEYTANKPSDFTSASNAFDHKITTVNENSLRMTIESFKEEGILDIEED